MAPSPQAPGTFDVTGLVLAGGRGLRMGGVDKGLQPWHGRPLVDHAIARLAPQVAQVLISANRHRDDYARRGCPVLADDAGDYPGPLAGILAGLRAARTPWLAVVPCDAPRLPADLVARLAAALVGDGVGTVVQRPVPGRGPCIEPVCCLLPVLAADDLADYLGGGGRKVEPWVLRHARPVAFDRADDGEAFANFNTLQDLVGEAASAIGMPASGLKT
jgi:molybdopterin-guanine dinucleotide biosynthesis protein A